MSAFMTDDDLEALKTDANAEPAHEARHQGGQVRQVATTVMRHTFLVVKKVPAILKHHCCVCKVC